VEGGGKQYDLTWTKLPLECSKLFLESVTSQLADRGALRVLDAIEDNEDPIDALLKFFQQPFKFLDLLSVRQEVRRVVQRRLSRRALDRWSLVRRSMSCNCSSIRRRTVRCLRLWTKPTLLVLAIELHEF
jgi:hypothetical protein